MYLDEVVTYFRLLADEPDKTFLPDSAIIPLLKMAYNKYHRAITDVYDKPYLTHHDLTSPAQTTDLTIAPNNLMGISPYDNNGRRLVRLDAVSAVSINGSNVTYLYTYDSAQSPTEFAQDGRLLYSLQDRKLVWNNNWNTAVPNTVRLSYVFYPDIDFTKINTGDNEYIDEFDELHDIIALLMYKQYAIKDVAINPAMENQLAIRMQDLKDYFSQGQAFQGQHYVGREYRRSYGTY